MSRAIEFLVALLIVGAAAVGVYAFAVHNTDNAWKAKDAKRLADEGVAREAEIRRGEKASGAYQAERQQQQIDYEQLTKAFNDYKRRHPILARRPVGPAAATVAAGQPAPVQRDAVPDGGDPHISLGAVWMWNSALVGRDVPAGTCGLADASEGACAADSGVSLNDAWSNQAINARTCAEDRLRYQRLIDFINNGKGK